MPSVVFDREDLEKLVGKRLPREQLEVLLSFAKAELENYGDELSIKYNDTNLPWIWSVEGMSVFLQGILGLRKGIPKIVFSKSSYEIKVGKSVEKVRPFIASFVAKGGGISEKLLLQLIQLQEKLADNYGRRRQKAAIGLYPADKIVFPVSYSAVSPDAVSFVPLEFSVPFTLAEILKEHPKGREYAYILKGAKHYPILRDNKNNVLSFPPVINSDEMGKLTVRDKELFFEVTGTDDETVWLIVRIFAFALYTRGFKIFPVKVSYPGHSEVLSWKPSVIKIKKSDVDALLGFVLKESEIKQLCEKMLYNYSAGKVEIPPFRNDIMHPVDVIEDIAVAKGYSNIPDLALSSYTIGGTFEIVNAIDKLRPLLVGLGYQEVLSNLLSSRKLLYDSMMIKDFGTVELEDFMSENYSVLRSWVLPVLLEFLSKNKHVDYPQKVFEEGLISRVKGDVVLDEHHVAFVSSHADASFTEVRQVLDFLSSSLGIAFSVKEFGHDSFIPGRVASIVANGLEVGFCGEISPAVLDKFGLIVPVVACEINLSLLWKK